MSNPNKAKGTAFESALRDLANSILAKSGLKPSVYRPAQTGRLDVGDLHGISPFIGQAKAYRDLTAALRDGVDGAQKQAVNAGEPFGVAFIKRPRRNVAEAYAVLPAARFFELLAMIRAADDEDLLLDRHPVTSLRHRKDFA